MTELWLSLAHTARFQAGKMAFFGWLMGVREVLHLPELMFYIHLISRCLWMLLLNTKMQSLRLEKPSRMVKCPIPHLVPSPEH